VVSKVGTSKVAVGAGEGSGAGEGEVSTAGELDTGGCVGLARFSISEVADELEGVVVASEMRSSELVASVWVLVVGSIVLVSPNEPD